MLKDIEKAFDKVWHSGLRHRLLQIGLPNLLVRSASQFLEGRTASVRERGHEGPAFPLLSGVPQGSCLSPTLFTLYTSDTPPPNVRDHATHIAYADDHTHLITSPTRFPAAQARNTERAITERRRYERRKKIRDHAGKLRVIAARRTRPAPLTVEGHRLQYARQGVILGLRIGYSGVSQQVKHNVAKAGRQMLKIKRFTKLPEKLKLKLYKSLVLPILEYPAVVLCTISKSSMHKLQRVQNKALMWVHGWGEDYRRPTNEYLHARYRIKPINQRLHELARRTWQSLERDDDPNLHNIIRLEEGLEEREEHKWFPRSRPRALGPTPAPLINRHRRQQQQ